VLLLVTLDLLLESSNGNFRWGRRSFSLVLPSQAHLSAPADFVGQRRTLFYLGQLPSSDEFLAHCNAAVQQMGNTLDQYEWPIIVPEIDGLASVQSSKSPAILPVSYSTDGKWATGA